MYVFILSLQLATDGIILLTSMLPSYSRVNEDSILAVQVFDQRKFKKKDQGFLGVVNIRVGDSVELLAESDGK